MELKQKEYCLHGRQILTFLAGVKDVGSDYNKLGCAYSLLVRYVIGSYNDEIAADAMALLSAKFWAYSNRLEQLLNCDICTSEKFIQRCDCLENFQAEIVKMKEPLFQQKIRRKKSNVSRTRQPVSLSLSELQLLYRLYYGHFLDLQTEFDLLIHIIRVAFIASHASNKPGYYLPITQFCTAFRMPTFNLLGGDLSNTIKLLQNWCSLIKVVLTGSFVCFQKIAATGNIESGNDLIDFGIGHCAQLLYIHSTLNAIACTTYCYDLRNILETIKSTLVFALLRGVVNVFCVVKTHYPLPLPIEHILKQRIHDISSLVISILDPTRVLNMIRDIFQFIKPVKSGNHVQESCGNNVLFSFFSHCSVMLRRDSSNWLEFLQLCQHQMPIRFCCCIPSRQLFCTLYIPSLNANTFQILKSLFSTHFDDTQPQIVDFPEQSILVDLRRWLGEGSCSPIEFLKLVSLTFHMMDEDEQRLAIQLFIDFYNGSLVSMDTKLAILDFFLTFEDPDVIEDFSTIIVMPNFNAQLMDEDLGPHFRAVFYHCMKYSESQEVTNDLAQLIMIAFNVQFESAMDDITMFVSKSSLSSYLEIMTLMDLHFLTWGQSSVAATGEFYLKNCERLANAGFHRLAFGFNAETFAISRLARLTAAAVKAVSLDADEYVTFKNSILAKGHMETVATAVTVANALLREASEWGHLFCDTPINIDEYYDADDEESNSKDNNTTFRLDLLTRGKREFYVDEDVLLLAVKLTTRSVTKAALFLPEDEIKLSEYLVLLRPNKFVDLEALETIADHLFECLDHFPAMTTPPPEALIRKFVIKTSKFVANCPKPHLLAKFLSGAFHGSEALTNTAIALETLLKERPLEPMIMLKMPQKPLDLNDHPHLKNFSPEIEPTAAASLTLNIAHQILLHHGMTISFWMAVDRLEVLKNHGKAYVHIASIGTSFVNAQLFADTTTGNLVLRYNINGITIKTITKRRIFNGNKERWQFIAFGFAANGDRLLSKYLLGHHVAKLELNLPLLPPNFSQSTFHICFGAMNSSVGMDNVFSYSLSTIFAFKSVLSKESIIAARALGCESQCLMECRGSKLHTSFASLMTRAFITSKNPPLLEVWSDPKKYISRIQRSSVFVIQADSAKFYGLSVLQRGLDSELLANVGESILCLTMYKEFPILWQSPIKCEKIMTLDTGLRAIGSGKLFLFLYALSVDRACSAAAQLSALQVLFVALRRSPALYGEFIDSQGIHVLTQVLNTTTTHFDDDIFNELCKFIFSELEPEVDGRTLLTVSFYTVILEPDLLKTLISTTDLWKGKYFKYFERLIHLCSSCLDNCKTMFCEFNSEVLAKVDFLMPLLHSLLDMQQSPHLFSAKFAALNFEKYAQIEEPLVLASKSVVASICVIVNELISSPFRCTSVTCLWKYILLSHAAQDTYLEYNFKGHREWILPEKILPPIYSDAAVVATRSLLSTFFEKVLMNFDKDKLADVWKQEYSISAIRDVILKTDTDFRIFSPGPTASTVTVESVNVEHSHNYPKNNHLTPSIGNDQLVDHWLTTLRTAMLSSMCNIVLCSDDSLIAVLELDVIYWKSILVQLTNQSNPNMRNQIFLLLQTFFHRCDKRNQIEFVQQHGFLLLASQLRKFPVNLTVADALFSMFCGEYVKIKDGLDEEHVKLIEITPFRQASFHALFALLEASAVDQSLFWTVCSTLQKIFEANVCLRKAMVNCGVADTLMNVLRLLSIQQQSIKRMIGPVFPLIDCWISFARSAITNVIVFADSYMYCRSKDLLLLCAVADYQLGSLAIQVSPGERFQHFSENLSMFPLVQPAPCSDCGTKMVRQILCQLIEAWIDSILAVVVDPGNTMIPVDERIENVGGESDSSYEIWDADSEYKISSLTYNGPRGDQKHKKSFEFAAVDELATRLNFGLEMANDLFVCAQIPDQISDLEENLFQKYLNILLAPWKKRNSESVDDYAKLLNAIKKQSRLQLAKLIAYVLFPAQLRQRQIIGTYNNIDEAGLLRRRLHIVRSLSDMLSKDRDCISVLLDVNLDYQYALKIALHELALCPTYSKIWSEYGEHLERLIRFLRTMQLESPVANLTREEVKSLSTDEIILLHTYRDNTKLFTTKLQHEALRLCEKSETLTKIVQDFAVTLTCSIAELQNEPRKLYIKSRKDEINACARANEVLANLVVELCHPFAPFYDESSWPKGWVLDTTENLHRERKRLKPSHYRFDLKFLKSEKRDEVGGSTTCAPPLQKLRESCPNFATTDYIEASNHVRLSLSATLVRSDYECAGEIIISDRKIHFLGETAKSTQKGVACQPVTLAWSYEQLSEVYYRHYLLKDTALELFTTTGDAFLIVFAATPDRDSFIEQLNRMGLGKLMAEEEKQLKLATQAWRCGNMTNFDYLMTVNKLAGRSFNDLMQYPVFPFILSNFNAPLLNLNIASNFRDLTRPMAIQKRSMEEVYIRNYEQLDEESTRHQEEVEQFTTASFGAYHYGSHYSNTGVVAYYLVRLLPYTNVALEYQDNNFDIPDRLFNSIETTWKLSSSDSTTDFKELTPEFFFLPEMFQNREQLNLGIRQAGCTVDNVVLPTWCPENNFRLFILIHRQALESAVVTASLHQWIDLIFGFKQQGPAAVKAINVFHPATYRGHDFESQQSHDGITLSALRTMVRTYGQMPTQLFLSPHLPHLNFTFDQIVSPGSSDAENLLNFVPSVKGLCWGEFVGSPELDRRLWLQPVLNLNLSSRVDAIGKLVPNNKEGFCYALPLFTELVHRVSVDAKDPLRRTFETTMTAVVSWGFSDKILRLKIVQMDDSVWMNLIDLQVLEPTQVAYSPIANLLYIGMSCGLIRIYSLNFQNQNKTWQVKLVSELFAHQSSITTLKICDDFHIVLSTSFDGQAHTWDLNQLTYIRQFVPSPMKSKETILATAISSINADIAIVYRSSGGSRLVLYTVNGDIVGTYTPLDKVIFSVAMTNIDEGTGINCIAVGMQDGTIRILESWTLSIVTDISVGTDVPVTSVEFTNEARRMYVAIATGRVFCWQSATATSVNAPNYRNRTKHDPAVKLLNPFT